MARRSLPSAADFPIPRDVAPGKGWSPSMLEMAEHIGAYATLVVCDRMGGEEVYVATDAGRSPFATLIGPDKAAVIARVYGRERIAIPTAGYALRVARRASVLAAARAGGVTVADVARILGIRRDSASRLVNRGGEGYGITPAAIGPAADPAQLDLFWSA